MNTRSDFIEKISLILTDSITGEIPTNPGVLECGHSFEKSEIRKWFEDHNTCPDCRQVHPAKNIANNYKLKALMDVILESFPELRDGQFFSPSYLKELMTTGTVSELISYLQNHIDKISESINGQTILHLAVSSNNLAVVKAVNENFKDKININALNQGKESVLQVAMRECKDSEIITYLLSNGANPVPQIKNITELPLMIGIIARNYPALRALLKAKEIYPQPTPMSCPSIFWSLAEDFPNDLFASLLARTPINLINAKFNTQKTSALYHAVAHFQADKVSLLLQIKDIDIEARNAKGESVYELAERLGFKPTIKLFNHPEIRMRIIMKQLQEHQWTQLANDLMQWYDKNKPNTLRENLNFIKHQTSPENYLKIYTQFFPVFFKAALKKKDFNLIMAILIPERLDKDFINGRTVLHWAASLGEDKFITQLFEKFPDKIDVNSLSTMGNTSLVAATRNNRLSTIQLLLSNPETQTNVTYNHKSLAQATDNLEIKTFWNYYYLMEKLLSEKENTSAIDLSVCTKSNPTFVSIKPLVLACLAKRGFNPESLQQLAVLIEDMALEHTEKNKKHAVFNENNKFHGVKVFNDLFSIANHGGSTNHGLFNFENKARAKKIRTEALEEFKTSLVPYDKAEKEKQILNARQQKIFNEHRHFFGFGRTQAVKELDKLLTDLKQEEISVVQTKPQTKSN